MKYLEIKSLQKLTTFLTKRSIGARVLDGRVEAFSCKAARDDKKLLKKLDRELIEELATSPMPEVSAASPIGKLSDSATRLLLIRLISTLNASYPDHDFTAVKANNFVKESDTTAVVHNVNKALSDVMTDTVGFCEQLWRAIHEVIDLPKSTVYSYVPDLDDDPLSARSLWSFNYFFYNVAEKKIVFFTCVARSQSAARADDDMLSDDEDDAVDMPAAGEDSDDDDGFFEWDDDVDM